MLAKNRVGANLGTGRFLTFFRAKQQELHFADVSVLPSALKFPYLVARKRRTSRLFPGFLEGRFTFHRHHQGSRDEWAARGFVDRLPWSARPRYILRLRLTALDGECRGRRRQYEFVPNGVPKRMG